ncbi:helix-turn-helix transcriptional regulator [Saccharopolyspora halophila]|uniref:Helix-turn-helix transcriptional regulator n=1 Tax=Saccharopolyspora halophila TaxID=405551 RepID=A0ABP5SLJ0_9PSEU
MAVTATTQTRALGLRLREIRESAGLSTRALATRLGIDRSTISRWESGNRVPGTAEVARALDACGVTGDARDETLNLSRGQHEPQWLAVSAGDRSRQLSALIDLERKARRITNVSPSLIPGLLQTSDYARAIMRAAEVPPGEIETRVATRIGRQEIITGRQPVELHALIGEAALWQHIGGATVLADQLRSLLDLSRYEHVTVQVIPAKAGWNPALEGQFVFLESSLYPPMVHIENRRAGLFFHEDADTAEYRSAVETVEKTAMSPAASVELIAGVIKELETTA